MTMETDAQIAAFDALRDLHAAVELALITRLEQIEGRVPTNAEVAAHALQAIYPSGTREFKWRGQTFLRVVPYQDGHSTGYRIIT
jgi:hypothetical protein